MIVPSFEVKHDDLRAAFIPRTLWANLMLGDVEGEGPRQEVRAVCSTLGDSTIMEYDRDLSFNFPEGARGCAWIAFFPEQSGGEWLARVGNLEVIDGGGIRLEHSTLIRSAPIFPRVHWLNITTRDAKTACGKTVMAFYPQSGMATLPNGETINCSVERNDVAGCPACLEKVAEHE